MLITSGTISKPYARGNTGALNLTSNTQVWGSFEYIGMQALWFVLVAAWISHSEYICTFHCLYSKCDEFRVKEYTLVWCSYECWHASTLICFSSCMDFP